MLNMQVTVDSMGLVRLVSPVSGITITTTDARAIIRYALFRTAEVLRECSMYVACATTELASHLTYNFIHTPSG